MKLNIKNRNTSAFTIVELIIVMVVIGVLATITVVVYNGVQQNAHQSALLSDLDNSAAIMAHDLNANGSYAATVTAADGGKGLPTNSGTTYQYTVNNSATPPTFCLTGTNSNIIYYINSNTDKPTQGVCPVLYYDAGIAASYPKSGTTWSDLSGNGNNGTLNGGVAYNSANGGILNFDGVSGYVSFPNDIVATSYIRANGITYSAWVKSTNTTSEQRIIGQKPSIGYSDLASGGLGISGNNAKMIAYDDNISYKSSIGNTALQNNTWYFITGTYDPSDKNIRIYINGKLDGTPTAIITFDRLTSNAENLIGTLHTTPVYSFSGSISSVSIYNRVLSANEINQNFNSQRSRYGL